MAKRTEKGKILDAATATGAGEKHPALNAARRVFQCLGSTSSGTGAATVKVQGSVDGTNWHDIGQFTLALSTTVTSDYLVSDSPWPFVRGNVTAISGTGAQVTIWMGC